jgi:CBS domain-containing protein
LADKFIKSSFKRYPVLDEDGNLVGQISRSDVLRAMDTLW